MEAAAGTLPRMGQYQVLRHMATGGMAQIFLARRDGMSGFERLVVLKRILPEYAGHQEFVRMFLNEARIAATLHHTNIVTVHDIGEEQGQVYFAMEFLHGEDLSRIVKRAVQVGQPLVLDSVLTIIAGVCAGLHYAHERRSADGRPLGIVHRDVSPHNVFVTYDGGVKLLDFGIAKASTSMASTRTGVLKGKVAYMSPEQAYSEPVDRRSDIFCIGILLWELTTGRRLYRRRSELETLKALVDHDAPPPSSVVSDYPPDLEAIVMKCLARKRDARWASADELDRALETFARDHRIGVSPSTTARAMRGLFASEIAAFEVAQQSGSNLTEHIIARIDATGTARTPGTGDWGSGEVEPSVVVDFGSSNDAEAEPTTIDAGWGDAAPADTTSEISDAVPTEIPTPGMRAKSITADPTLHRPPVRLPGVPGADEGPRRSAQLPLAPPSTPSSPAIPTAVAPPVSAVAPVAPGVAANRPPPPTERVAPMVDIATSGRAPFGYPAVASVVATRELSLRPRRRLLGLLIGAVLAGGMLAVILAVTGGDDERARPTAAPTAPAAPAVTTPTPAPAPAAAPAATAAPVRPAPPPTSVDKPIAKPKRVTPAVVKDRPVAETSPSRRHDAKPSKSRPKKPSRSSRSKKKKPSKSDLDSLPL